MSFTFPKFGGGDFAVSAWYDFTASANGTTVRTPTSTYTTTDPYATVAAAIGGVELPTSNGNVMVNPAHVGGIDVPNANGTAVRLPGKVVTTSLTFAQVTALI